MTTSQEIVNSFNDYFVNIGNGLRSENSVSNEIPIAWCNSTFFLNPKTPIELCNIVDSLENKASLDYDELSNSVLKIIFIYIVDVVSHIFNLSFSSGIVPDKLKIAVVIPLFKKGDRKLKENYRPISLLPIFSKILEKAMKARMMTFLYGMQFFSDCQYGFREKLNMELALIQFLNEVYSSLNSNMKPVSVFVDIKKAFDMVDHKLLLDIMFSCGFRGVSLNWFASYFRNRKQCVNNK